MHQVVQVVVIGLTLSAVPAARAQWGTSPPGWPSFAGNSQHWGRSNIPAQPLERIKWSASVNDNVTSGAHYGSPLVTPDNIVIFPVHTAAGFRVEARRSTDGTLVWSRNSGFIPQSSWWLAVCGCTLTPSNHIVIPESGGRVLIRGASDPNAPVKPIVFYGEAAYAANPGAYDANIRICTPISCDGAGNCFFGYVALGATPLNLQSGIVRMGPEGKCSFITAAAAAQDPTVLQAALNCAPAIGYNGQIVYLAAVDSGGHGYMLGLDSKTLQLHFRARLRDPHLNSDAYVIDLSTASPTIGPDGDVYYGVFDAGWNNNDRGWMLHFDAKLAHERTPGAFGWDHTASIVPASIVPSYHGSSSYLLLCKYNNYANIGSGDGANRVAILDPNATQIDPITGVTTMREVMTILGPTPEPPAGPNAVREWCINNAAIDVTGRAAIVNSEDGRLYRWDLTTNTLSEAITLITGAGVPYTPTLIGPDGTVYAINNSVLCAVGR